MPVLEVPDFASGEEIVKFGLALRGMADVTLDFSKLRFARPTGMMLLTRVISEAVAEGRVIGQTGAVPYSYAANMGFFDFCGLPVEHHTANGGENYLPITMWDVEEIKAAADDAGLSIGAYVNIKVGRLAYLVTRTSSGNLFDLVKYCFREIIRNTVEHGNGSKIYISGQYWPSEHAVEICIADDGIGLRAGLAENPQYKGINSDSSAIRLAILPSVSGKRTYTAEDEIGDDSEGDEWQNSGFGLYITSQLARRSGFFLLGSGEAYHQLAGSNKSEGDFCLPGTFVGLRFNVQALARTAMEVESIARKGESFAKRHLTSGIDVMASAASKFLVE